MTTTNQRLDDIEAQAAFEEALEAHRIAVSESVDARSALDKALERAVSARLVVRRTEALVVLARKEAQAHGGGN